MSQCSRATISTALTALDNKVEIFAVLHKVSCVIRDMFFNILLVDETGSLAARVFLNSQFFTLPHNDCKNKVGTACKFILRVTEYSKTRERTATLYDLSSEEEDERLFEVETWYSQVYINTKFQSRNESHLSRVDLNGTITDRLFDTINSSTKITYILQTKNGKLNVLIWNEEGEGVSVGASVLMRNLKKDYYKEAVQYTMDDLSDVIHMNTVATPASLTTSDSTNQKRKMTQDNRREPEHCSMFNTIESIVRWKPTVGTKKMIEIVRKIPITDDTAAAIMFFVTSVLDASYNDERNRVMMVNQLYTLISTVPYLPPDVALSFSTLLEHALQHCEKKTRTAITKDLHMFIATEDHPESDDDESAMQDNEVEESCGDPTVVQKTEMTKKND